MDVTRMLPAAVLLAFCGCSKPEPPTITPVSGRVTSISPAGITVEAKLQGDNPNSFDIALRSCTAKLTLDNRYNVGPVSVPHAVELPAKEHKTFEVPITFNWNDVLGLAPLALSNRDVPYVAEGTVKVKVESIEAELPFKVSGVVTHAQLAQAVGKSLPAIPALPF